MISQLGPTKGSKAEASQSTARTAKPQSSSSRTWRPAPAAKSSTNPPGLISGAHRSTQGEGAAGELEIGTFFILSSENCYSGAVDVN